MGASPHDFVIVIPVADRPRQLAACLASLQALLRRHPYPGGVAVLIADDSREPGNLAHHRALAEDCARGGLPAHHLGQAEQLALLDSLSPQLRTRLAGVDFGELVSEGNMALLRSVEKFDCTRGFKFSTYACRAILKSFARVAIRTSRYRGRFPAEFDPTLEKSDLAERKRGDAEQDCVSELRDILENNTAQLSDVERTVIRERFALDAAPSDKPIAPKTLEQVGALIGVTKERVRQIQNKALRKIRSALEESILAA